MGRLPNGGLLSRISVFFLIIEGFIFRLTKLLLKAVIVLFFTTRVVSSNSYPPSCRQGGFLRIIPLRNRHSGRLPI